MIKVTAAIILKGNKFLIAKRKNGKWEFPGGRVEKGESYEECLKREIREELDIHINILKSFTIVSRGNIELHTYIAICKDEPVAKEHEELKWISIGETDNYEFMPPDKKIIRELDEKWSEIIQLSKTYTQ